jgi:hypothetical protein
MNRMVLCMLAIALVAGLASADTTCTSGPLAVNSSTMISCGGLTFSNFNVINAGGVSNPVIDYVSSDTATGSVNIQFNPNLSGANGPQDLHFYYEVSGAPLTGVDLTTGGVNATIIERVCSTSIPSTGPNANTCPDSTSLANMIVFSSGPISANQTFPMSVNTAFVYKDIGVGSGGGLTSFTQSWHSEIPEPTTFLLIGPALLGLGLLRRRIKA